MSNDQDRDTERVPVCHSSEDITYKEQVEPEYQAYLARRSTELPFHPWRES